MEMQNVIKGLEFTKAMITFNPSTGEDIEPGNLNEADKTTYDACVGAIALLKEQDQRIMDLLTDIVSMKMIYGDPGKIVGELIRCKDCKHYKDGRCFFTMRRYGLHDDWFCADGERRNLD